MTPIPQTLATQFKHDGFCVAPPIIPQALIDRVIPRMDAVMAGEYETGVPPKGRTWHPGDDEHVIRKINHTHACDRTIYELLTYPEIGRWAAAITGAKMVQLWASQQLYKPPGGKQVGNIGWHQDKQYWPYWDKGVFTAWIAVSDVTAASGPMCFVRGSHRWGNLGEGDFFSHDNDGLRQNIAIPEGETWEEAPAILTPGAVSFHHCMTFHGSGPNLAAWPRRSFALHLRTEQASPVPGVEDHGYCSHLDDMAISPIIYQAE